MIITKQRQYILDYFDANPTFHPTAEQIYDYVKLQESTIGIATVYRTLKKLVELGTLRELNLEKQGVHYDLAIKEHYHFICDTCGTIENIIVEELDHINPVIERTTHGKVTRKNIIFHGICENCLKHEG